MLFSLYAQETAKRDEELARRMADAEFNMEHTTRHTADEELALQLTREELVNDYVTINYTY